MKTLSVILIFILLNFELYAQKQKDVIVICHSIGWGNGDYYTLVGLEDKSLNKVQQNRELGKLRCDKYIVNRKTFHMLENFINANCMMIENKEVHNYESFTFQILSQDKLTTCFIESRKDARIYFDNLIKWMKVPADDKGGKELVKLFVGTQKGFDYIPLGLKSSDIK